MEKDDNDVEVEEIMVREIFPFRPDDEELCFWCSMAESGLWKLEFERLFKAEFWRERASEFSAWRGLS